MCINRSILFLILCFIFTLLIYLRTDTPITYLRANNPITYLRNITYYDCDEKRYSELCISTIHKCCTYVFKSWKGTEILRENFDRDYDQKAKVMSILEKLKNKKLLFVGDSLSKQSANALVMTIDMVNVVKIVKKKNEYFKVSINDGEFKQLKECKNIWDGYKSTCGKNCSCNIVYGWNIPEYNIEITFYSIYTVYDKDITALYKSSNWIKDNDVVKPYKHPYYFNFGSIQLVKYLVNRHDHTILNIGQHEEMLSGYEFVTKLRHLLNILNNVNGKNFYRLTLPQHYTNGEFWTDKKISKQPVPRHWTDTLAIGAYYERKYDNVILLDYYEWFNNAWFMHGKDGTHYCFNAKLWMPFINSLITFL